jgi:hypothetical protein
MLNNISHYGDILAIPFFLLAFLYFYNKKDKTTVEFLLLYFSLGGLLFDIYFTYIFVSK